MSPVRGGGGLAWHLLRVLGPAPCLSPSTRGIPGSGDAESHLAQCQDLFYLHFCLCKHIPTGTSKQGGCHRGGGKGGTWALLGWGCISTCRKGFGFATLLAFNQGFVWTRSPLRSQERGRGMRGRIRPWRGEEVLCLLARGRGFKGSGRTQPQPDFRPPGTGREWDICGDAARTEQGSGAHPAPLLVREPSDAWGPSWTSSSPGCLSARC